MKKNFNKLAVAMMMISGVMVSSNASAHDLFTSSKGVSNELFPPTVNASVDQACGKVSGVVSGKVSGVVSGKVSGVTCGKVSGVECGKVSGFNEAVGVSPIIDKLGRRLDVASGKAAGFRDVACGSTRIDFRDSNAVGFRDVAIVRPRIDFANGYRDCEA